MQSFGALLINEWIKLKTSRLVWLAFFTVAFWAYLWDLGTQLLGAARQLDAFTSVRMATQASVTSFHPYFIVVVAALTLVQEREGGTLRRNLCAPVSRSAFLLAKVVMMAFYAVALVLCQAGLVALLTARHTVFEGYREFQDVVVPLGQILQDHLIAYALLMLPVMTMAVFGFFLSVVCRSLAGALGLALMSVTLLLYVDGFLPESWGVDRWLFLNTLGVPLSVAEARSLAVGQSWWTTDVYHLIYINIISIFVFLIPSWVLFLRGDLVE
jgi:ABC-type transport system involved in multi-copper enzyme maturation permease subunit